MKKITLTLFAFAVTGSALMALPPGKRAKTPYDPYMHSVHRVMRQLDGQSPDFRRVAALTRQGYKFRYEYKTPYVAPLPHVTAAKKAGDCKAKSLWLAHEMNDPKVRYVIGKARANSKISHAWLMWQHNGQWWILDPTNDPRPIRASSVSSNEYIVFYSYGKTGSYRHQRPFQHRAVGSR